MFLQYHGLDTLHITTRAQAKAAGQAIPKVHGVDKGLDTHLKPEHQSRSATNVTPKQAPTNSNVQSIARILISRSIKHLSKSATGITITTPVQTQLHLQNQTLIPETSAQPHYFLGPPCQPFLYLSMTMILTWSPLASTPPVQLG